MPNIHFPAACRNRAQAALPDSDFEGRLSAPERTFVSREERCNKAATSLRVRGSNKRHAAAAALVQGQQQ